MDWIIGEVLDGRAANPSMNQLTAIIHKANEKWWVREACWVCKAYVESGFCTSTACVMWGTRQEPILIPTTRRNKGELIALMHSELSEGLEGERKGQMDDHLPKRPMIEVELADALIRIFDYAGAFGYDLEGAFWEKLAYNRDRHDHSYEARMAEGGKKF